MSFEQLVVIYSKSSLNKWLTLCKTGRESLLLIRTLTGTVLREWHIYS